MATTDELLPCPFCGGRADVVEAGLNGRMTTYGLVEHADGCWLRLGLPSKYQHVPLFEFDAWNRRAVEATLGREECHIDFVGYTQTKDTYQCRSCGESWTVPRGRLLGYNFCPNCGRRCVG